jgi:phospholipid-binding lipoprotein MlaA
MHTKWGHALVIAALLALSACTNAPAGRSQVDEDPLEPLNRGIYQFNYMVDGAILKPVTMIYRGVMPDKGEEMVHNFIVNIYTPVIFANSVLQGDPENSFSSFWRFVVNTTMGLGGIFDVASETSLKVRDTNFGDTLAVYGCSPGPYLVLPIIGPSNGRDAVGRVADAFLNPFNYVDEGVSYTLWTATAVDQRNQNMKLLDDIYNTSLDPYSTFRSGYAQKRNTEIKRALASREKAQEKAGFK